MPPLNPQDLHHILQHTAPLWDEMRHRRLFLTGGTGFFGNWLVESFLYVNHVLSLDASITVLTRGSEAFRAKAPHLVSDPALTLLQGDVRDFLFPNADLHFIIHAATEASLQQQSEQPQQMLSTLIAGTERVLSLAQQRHTHNLLLTSSGAVYGPQPPTLTHVPETFTGAPNPLALTSVYAEGKRVAELLCALAASSTLSVKIARCFAFVGPHLPLDRHFAIGNFIADAQANRPIHIAGDGTPLRSYLYAADLMIWLWTILFRAPSLRAFNVGSEQAISIHNLAQTIASNAPVHVAQTSLGYLPSRYVPSTYRARTELGLRQIISLDDAINRTKAWHSQNRSFPNGRQ